MDTQPNEIITYILSYMDNFELLFTRLTCKKWKQLIEERIFTPHIPPFYICILNKDYYHFGKHYLNYIYDEEIVWAGIVKLYAYTYYVTLSKLVDDEHFKNSFPGPQNNDHYIYNSPYPKKYNKTECNLYYQRSPEYNSGYFLIYAANKGHYEVVKYMIKKTACNIHFLNDMCLRHSAKNGHLDIVKYLITKGANIHVNEDSPLKHSAKQGHTDVVKFLISCGADPNVAIQYGTQQIIESFSNINNL